jgi:DNA mismatch endonuclease (patch repair protein)
MAAIRSVDTRPELALRRGMWAAGLRGWRCHPAALPGRPDVVFGGRAMVAIFVDGRFWHGHPHYFTHGRSGAYWDEKITRTQERDRRADERLRAAGWLVLRFWDLQVEGDLDGCVATIASAVDKRRQTTANERREL